MRALLTIAWLLAGAAYADENSCLKGCDQIPDVCTKACSSKGSGNSGICKSKCDEAAKKCRDTCAKRDK